MPNFLFLDEEFDDIEDKATYKSMLTRDERRFKTADRDGDGTATREEFTAFLHPEEFDYMKDLVVQVLSKRWLITLVHANKNIKFSLCLVSAEGIKRFQINLDVGWWKNIWTLTLLLVKYLLKMNNIDFLSSPH